MAGHYPDWPDTFTGPGGLGISDYCGYRILVSKNPLRKEYTFTAYEMNNDFTKSTGKMIQRTLSFTKKSDAYERAVAIIDAEIELQGDAQ
jgi:hypothetical protein